MLSIMGQPRAIAQLQRALVAGRLPHAFLFGGPAGVGKFRTALALAKTALCDRPMHKQNDGTNPILAPDFSLVLPCNVCESCHAVDTGNHPDVHIITKELIRYHDGGGKSKGTTIGIDVIRGEITGSSDPEHPVEAKIYKRPFRGPSKWFIIDEADLMQPPAQNALLKTLEEPPAHSYLILITPSPQELLQTIRSRSQFVEFFALPADVVMHGLIGQGVPNDDAAILARLADGSLGKAVRWGEDRTLITNKLAAASAKKAKKKAAAGDDTDGDEDGDDLPFTIGGIAGWVRKLCDALDAFADGKAAASEIAALLLKLATEYAGVQLIRDPLTSKDRATRDGIGLMLAITAEWLDDRVRGGLGTPRAQKLPGNAGTIDPDQAVAILAQLRNAEAQIDLNAHVQLLLASTMTAIEQLLRAPIEA
jgi:DNA polymerase III delta' subunit